MIAGKEIEIVSHVGQHRDEYVAEILASVYGSPEFLVRYSVGGAIYIGIGADRVGEHIAFDEHGYPGKGIMAKTGECATTIMAKRLGLEMSNDSPALNALIEETLDKDDHANADPLDMSAMIKKFHRHPSYVNNPEAVAEWAYVGFSAKLGEDPDSPRLKDCTVDHIYSLLLLQNPDDKQFAEGWIAQAREVQKHHQDILFEEAGRIYTEQFKEAGSVYCFFRAQHGKRYFSHPSLPKRATQYAVIASDNPAISLFSRSKTAYAGGIACAFVVQVKSTGHVLILPDMRRKISLKKVIGALRNRVLRAKGLPELSYDDPMLYTTEALDSVPEIYYLVKDNELMLNGSETHPDVTPLLAWMSLEEILEIIDSNIEIRLAA